MTELSHEPRVILSPQAQDDTLRLSPFHFAFRLSKASILDPPIRKIQVDSPTYRFGRYEINAVERLLRRDGEPVPLRPKALPTLLLRFADYVKRVGFPRPQS